MNPRHPSAFREFVDRLAGLFGAIGPSDFVIRARPGRTATVRGRLARSRVPGIVGFFGRDLDLRGPVVVRGTRHGATLRLRFSGPLDAGDRQRVRNFLVDHLR